MAAVMFLHVQSPHAPISVICSTIRVEGKSLIYVQCFSSYLCLYRESTVAYCIMKEA